MAELIYAIGGVIAIALGTTAAQHVSDLIFSEAADRRYARARFGPNLHLFVATVFDVRQLRRTEDQTLKGSDKAVMAFKSAHLSSIGQTSVASAIVAQLCMTTLQLPGLDSVHWTAPAFVVVSLVFGVLGLMVACVQQQILGMLNDADRVRLWLSNGSYSNAGNADGAEEGEAATTHGGASKPRLQASIAALVVLRLPNAFLSYGVICFLTGLGLYLGFAARQDLQNTPGRNNNLAVMVLFVVVAVFTIALAAAATVWKLWESSYAEAALDSSQDEDRRPKSGRAESTEVDERSPLLGRSSTDGRDAEVQQALQAMAKAHEECAKAERRLADLMKRD